MDIEKALRIYKYIMNPDNINKDIEEFMDILKQVTNLFVTKETASKMHPFDLLEFINYSKEYSDNIKPLVIKYGILGEIQNATKEGDKDG